MELKSGRANMSRKLEGIAGELTLDSKQLRFEPKGLNVQKSSEVIELSTISAIEKVWTKAFGSLPVYPSSLEIHTSDGRQLRFAVQKREEWIAAIDDARKSFVVPPPTGDPAGSLAPPRASVPPPA
jgi:hypothetical protein